MGKSESLFDEHGRRIPSKELSRMTGRCNSCVRLVVKPDRKYFLEPPKLDGAWDYEEPLKRLGIMPALASHIQFMVGDLSARIKKNRRIANILNGVCLPVVLPAIPNADKDFDLGELLEEWVGRFGKNYAEAFGNRRQLKNKEAGRLKGNVTFAPGSRQDDLLAMMKDGRSFLFGLLFPAALQGYSVEAQRLQMADLPKGFFLSGVDLAIAAAAFPEVFGRDEFTPRMELGALRFSPPHMKELSHYPGETHSFVFGFPGAEEEGIFDDTGDLDLGVDCCAGGLFYCLD